MVESLAADAVKVFVAFVDVAEVNREATLDLSECIELGLSIVVCQPDRGGKVIAGKSGFRCQLNERLAQYLPAPKLGV